MKGIFLNSGVLGSLGIEIRSFRSWTRGPEPGLAFRLRGLGFRGLGHRQSDGPVEVDISIEEVAQLVIHGIARALATILGR